MASSTRIDQLSSLALEARFRKQNVPDDSANDLFARALDRQLAEQHEENLTRNSPSKARQVLANRIDRKPAPNAQAADATTRDDAKQDDTAKNPDISRKTIGTQANTEPNAKATTKAAPAQAQQPKARATTKPADANGKPDAPDTKCAAAQPDADSNVTETSAVVTDEPAFAGDPKKTDQAEAQSTERREQRLFVGAFDEAVRALRGDEAGDAKFLRRGDG